MTWMIIITKEWNEQKLDIQQTVCELIRNSQFFVQFNLKNREKKKKLLNTND
jgi:hypothetical protein